MVSINRAIFLDRDGVINQIVFRDGVPCSPRNMSEFTVIEGTQSILNYLKDEGFINIVVTNQPDIARGLVSSEVIAVMHGQLRELLAVDDVLVCPHDDRDECDCRKPKPGMLLKAAQRWSIDLTQSFMIGDRWKDVEAGRAANCTSILLDYPHNQDTNADFRVDDLSSALKLIRGYERKDS